MAEIKSSIEIALERAAAMAGDDDSDATLEETRQQAQILARRFLAGDLLPRELEHKLREYSGAAGEAARQRLVELLLEALPEKGGLALQGLRVVLAEQEDSAAPLDELQSALERAQNAEAELKRELAKEMREQLAEQGISGPALRPNPQAHPQFEARRRQALEDDLAPLEQARQRLLDLVAGG